MLTSLSLAAGTLWVARLDPRPRVQAHDLDGRELAAGFVVPPDAGAARVRIAGLAVDADRRVWIADQGSARVRAFTAFGRELSGLARDGADRPGSLGEPASVSAGGVESEARLLVASRGERVHALQVVDAGGRLAASLHARGEPREPFRGLGRCALDGDAVWACEPASGLVQVFRRGAFHCAFRLPGAAVPVAIAPVDERRAVVATGGEGQGALLLVGLDGRVLGVLAPPGADAGSVLDPEDVAVARADGDRRTRVFVADGAGQRIQVFNLEGTCYGAFAREGEGRAGEAR